MCTFFMCLLLMRWRTFSATGMLSLRLLIPFPQKIKRYAIYLGTLNRRLTCLYPPSVLIYKPQDISDINHWCFLGLTRSA